MSPEIERRLMMMRYRERHLRKRARKLARWFGPLSPRLARARSKLER
jgi:hypothetical protein